MHIIHYKYTAKLIIINNYVDKIVEDNKSNLRIVYLNKGFNLKIRI
jgi:hypothetical protein